MEFIVSEIEAEAIRAGRPLREPERRMLFFSETGSGAREVAETFEAEGRQDEYEQRIARLIRAARQRADRQRAVAWRDAVSGLRRDTRDYSISSRVKASSGSTKYSISPVFAKATSDRRSNGGQAIINPSIANHQSPLVDRQSAIGSLQ